MLVPSITQYIKILNITLQYITILIICLIKWTRYMNKTIKQPKDPIYNGNVIKTWFKAFFKQKKWILSHLPFFLNFPFWTQSDAKYLRIFAFPLQIWRDLLILFNICLKHACPPPSPLNNVDLIKCVFNYLRTIC